MRLPLVARSLLSGALVYVLASACAATSHIPALDGDDSGGAGVSQRSPSDSIRDAIADVVDEIVTPVPDAKAADPEPDIATESCLAVLKFNGSDAYFAQHHYPGKTRTDLATLHTLVESSQVEGYTDALVPPTWVRDGSAVAFCGYVVAGAVATKITFVLPAK